MFPLKDNLRCDSPATITTWLIIANVLAFFWEVGMIASGHQAEFFGTWLMVPHNFFAAIASGDPSAMAWAGVTVFASMFLHGSLGHIFGNMFFLYVFGKAVENRIGKARFLVFYLVSGVLAALTHAFSDPSSMVPTLGASGAIAGVLGAYLLFWWNAKIRGFVFTPIPVFVEAPSWNFLIAWLFMQFSGALDKVGMVSGSGVAYWAHIGGFLAGFAIGGLIKIMQPNSSVCIIPKPACETPEEDAEEKEAKK